MFFRNESNIVHVRLAVIDYDAHVEREVASNREGDIIYHRKYRKQRDVTPVRCHKEYPYMKELVADILKMREESDLSMRSKLPLSSNHPHNIQLTIGQDAPPETLHIISNKQSRF